MSNCGQLGWVTDTRGYRYVRQDPVDSAPWPAMPPVFLQLAARMRPRPPANADFVPDACLLNRYCRRAHGAAPGQG